MAIVTSSGKVELGLVTVRPLTVTVPRWMASRAARTAGDKPHVGQEQLVEADGCFGSA